MTDRMGGHPERRRYIRIAPKGTVILIAGEHTQRGRIADLGRGGMMVATAITAPDRLLARPVEVELRLDGQYAEWLHASGRIIRITADGIAILFEQIPASLVRLIDEMSAASSAHL